MGFLDKLKESLASGKKDDSLVKKFNTIVEKSENIVSEKSKDTNYGRDNDPLLALENASNNTKPLTEEERAEVDKQFNAAERKRIFDDQQKMNEACQELIQADFDEIVALEKSKQPHLEKKTELEQKLKIVNQDIAGIDRLIKSKQESIELARSKVIIYDSVDDVVIEPIRKIDIFDTEDEKDNSSETI